MNNKINDRTPKEIKKGLECCSIDKLYCSKECPYLRECYFEGKPRAFIHDTLALIQQLERERDAAVAQLKEVDTRDIFYCSHCKHEELCNYELNSCEDCDKDCPCATCYDMCNWEWKGVKEEA